jgi:hypothetical protein
MDWVERIFHVSPDGGSGAYELALALAVVVVLCTVGALAARAARRP